MEIKHKGDIEKLMYNVDNCETLCLNIYHSKLLTDVNFKFIYEPTVIVQSHKLLLAFRSPVFHTMFYGAMAIENNLDNSILIDDISSRIFGIILKYVYTFKLDTSFNHRDNLEILYVAQKYILKDLEKRILDVINDSINVTNGCFYLKHSDIYGGIDNKKCLQVLATNFTQLTTDSTFLSLNYDQVVKLLTRDDCDCREVLILKAALKWFEKWYKKKDMGHDPRLSGDELLRTFLNKTIRFLLLTMEEFQTHVVVPELLTSEENLNIKSCINQMSYLPDQKANPKPRTRASMKAIIQSPPSDDATPEADIIYAITGDWQYVRMKPLNEYGISIVCPVDLKVKGITIPSRSCEKDAYTIVASTNGTKLRVTFKMDPRNNTDFRKITFDRSIHVKANVKLYISVHFITDFPVCAQLKPSINYNNTQIVITSNNNVTMISGLIL